MRSDVDSLSALLARVRQAITGPSGPLALRGASAIREALPGSPLSLCRTWTGANEEVRILDREGAQRDDWAALFPTTPPTGSPLPMATGLEGLVLAAHTRTLPDGSLVEVAVAIPPGAPEAGAILECVSAELLLQLVAGRSAGGSAISEGRELEKADLGELAGPMIHAFNNLLNNLQLHLTILEHSAAEGLLATIGTLRRYVGSNTEMIKEFERYRRAFSAGAEVVDVNEAIREACAAVEREASGGLPARLGERACRTVPVALNLAPDLPPVRGDAADLLRVGRWLVRNAKRAAADAPVGVETQKGSDKVLVRVVIPGADFSADQLKHLFEPARAAPGGMSALELAACESICRRALLAKIRAQRAEGATVIQVDLPAVA